MVLGCNRRPDSDFPVLGDVNGYTAIQGSDISAWSVRLFNLVQWSSYLFI